MKYFAITLLFFLSFGSTVEARTLGLYVDVTNALNEVVYVRLCASNEEHPEAIGTCEKSLTQYLRLEPGQMKKAVFIVHWGGYKLHWKVFMPRDGVANRTGMLPFDRGEAGLVITATSA